MIRALDLVWDCPDDAAVNATGYRCAGCRASRAFVELTASCRHPGEGDRLTDPDN